MLTGCWPNFSSFDTVALPGTDHWFAFQSNVDSVFSE
jgi:hypothetical protein